MAQTYTLEAQPRSVIGKKVGALRRQGLVPAVVYGSKIEPIQVQIPYRPLQVTLSQAGGTHVIELSIDGKTQTVLARSVQRDVIRGDILHVDFQAIDASTKIRASVPLHLVGDAPAEKARVGMLQTNVNTVTIEALPSELMDAINIDVTALRALGDAVHVRDLVLPAGVTVVDDPDDMLVRIVAFGDATAEDFDAAPVAAEPEVIKKGKQDEEDEA